MRKAAIFALCFAATGNSLSSPVETPPMDSKVSPWSFRQFTDHHKQPCADASYQCLAKHLMYLQCGAVLVEKLAFARGRGSAMVCLQHAQRTESSFCSRRLFCTFFVRSILASELVFRR